MGEKKIFDINHDLFHLLSFPSFVLFGGSFGVFVPPSAPSSSYEKIGLVIVDSRCLVVVARTTATVAPSCLHRGNCCYPPVIAPPKTAR